MLPRALLLDCRMPIQQHGYWRGRFFSDRVHEKAFPIRRHYILLPGVGLHGATDTGGKEACRSADVQAVFDGGRADWHGHELTIERDIE